MKKTITSLALIMSASSAYAFVGPTPGHIRPRPMPVERTYCLNQYDDNSHNSDGSTSVSDCDSNRRNRMTGAPLMRNGCAEGQVALKTTRVVINSCPVAVQL